MPVASLWANTATLKGFCMVKGNPVGCRGHKGSDG